MYATESRAQFAILSGGGWHVLQQLEALIDTMEARMPHQ